MRTTILASFALALGVAGCGGEPAQSEATANPDAPAGITITDARMNLPGVAGNPGAVYFTVANASERDMNIRAAFVDGAGSAAIHQMGEFNRAPVMEDVMQVPVPAGGSVAFEPGGLHVMAMDLDEGLAAGGETEVTLTFLGGDKVSFPVTILEPGEMPPMEGMDN